MTWSRNTDECEIATPTIQYSRKDLTVDMNGQTTEQEVWVGYYQQTALFEYIGKFIQIEITNIYAKLVQ
jgi:hypothetical protein